MSQRHGRRPLVAALLLIGVMGCLVVAIVAAAGDRGDDHDEAASGPVTVPTLPADIRGMRFPGRGQEAGFSDSGWMHYGLGDRYDAGVSPEAEVEWARGAGATLQRIPFDWRQAEPREGTVDQGYVDRVTRFVDRFEVAGGRVVVFLFAAPGWAQVRGACGRGDCIAPPATTAQGLRAWRRFVRLAARTFTSAAAFEIWNEPNFGAFWQPRPDPAAYARLANAARSELRTAVPRAKVLVGSLAGVSDGDGRVSAGRFLREAAARGLDTGFDAVSWHVYPTQRGGRVPNPADDPGVARVLRDIRDGIRLYDPLIHSWVTEAGVTRTGRGYGVAPNEQAIALLRLYRYLSRQPNVDAVLLHQLVERVSVPTASPERGYGIVRPLGPDRQAATPAWCVLRVVADDPGPTPLDARCRA